MALEVSGDLTFTVEGPSGSTSGTVTGSGSTVRVQAGNAVVAWDAALGSPVVGGRVLPVVAEQLHREGVVLEVDGPDGRVATVGAGIDSPLGRLLAGSRRVRLGTPAAVRPLAVAQARRTARLLARRAAVPAAVAAALAVLAVGRRRRA